MINKELIHTFIDKKLLEDEAFVVEVKVSPTNRIYVEIDSINGLSIDYCVIISKLIESQIDREQEDFELEVSTSSISAPFKVFNHYKKNIGREVELITLDNIKRTGVLKEVTTDNFTLENEALQKVEGKKKKQVVVNNDTFSYSDVRSIKQIIKI